MTCSLSKSHVSYRKPGAVSTRQRKTSPGYEKNQKGAQNGELEPKLIPKYQRDISGIEEKVSSVWTDYDSLVELYKSQGEYKITLIYYLNSF